MLKCSEIASKSSDYLDDRLSRREKLGVRMHLFMCTHCRRFVRHLRLSLRFFSRLGGRYLLLPEQKARQIADTTKSRAETHEQ